ncbi:hypothetical protein LCGC14_0468530 [marine sediment metagenome]|uniref:HK97 gp10 family phage protein n=1 Tax=marine sediment metagenome TaxID=412755 RepID=A0A0F9SVT7_9ZZZZ
MADPLQLNIGRVRRTVAASPSEKAYIKSIRDQASVIKQNLLKVINYIDNITPEAIRFGLKPIFDESQRLVPVDEGTLKASGFVEVRKTATGASAVIGYARHGRPHYAGFVHERLDIHHAPPTQAKFLETAINTHIDDFRRRVALFYQKNTGLSK